MPVRIQDTGTLVFFLIYGDQWTLGGGGLFLISLICSTFLKRYVIWSGM